MKKERRNAASRAVLQTSLRRQGKKNFTIKTLARSKRSTAGVYEVTYR